MAEDKKEYAPKTVQQHQLVAAGYDAFVLITRMLPLALPYRKAMMEELAKVEVAIEIAKTTLRGIKGKQDIDVVQMGRSRLGQYQTQLLALVEVNKLFDFYLGRVGAITMRVRDDELAHPRQPEDASLLEDRFALQDLLTKAQTAHDNVANEIALTCACRDRVYTSDFVTRFIGSNLRPGDPTNKVWAQALEIHAMQKQVQNPQLLRFVNAEPTPADEPVLDEKARQAEWRQVLFAAIQSHDVDPGVLGRLSAANEEQGDSD